MNVIRRGVSAHLAVAFGLGTLLAAPTAQLPVQAESLKAAAAVTPPAKPERLNYKVVTLKNGLRVILLEDHRAPVVTLQVYYRVGAKDEKDGRFGFAHLFEHMMFKGSKNVAPEEHARFVEQIGARYNAYTHWDRTVYFETVPVNALERMLFLEADRMASLNVNEANLKSEREVVKEEYGMRVANAPYGRLIENLSGLVYPEGHPYRHTPIGSIPDLNAATLEDVRAFHLEYYRPDNATLVLVGDFKTPEALEKIEKYLGGIARSPDANFERRPVPEPAAFAPRKETFYDDRAPLPLVGMTFRLPKPSDPDAPVFDVISQVLSEGHSSRLYRALVRDKQLAVEAEGAPLTLQLGGAFYVFAIANQGKAPADLEAAMQAEVERLRTTPVSEAELTKAKNQTLTGRVFGTISTEEKANALGLADVTYGDPEEANRSFDKLAAVTAADVQRVAQKYFASERRNTFYILPAAMRPKDAPTTKEVK